MCGYMYIYNVYVNFGNSKRISPLNLLGTASHDRMSALWKAKSVLYRRKVLRVGSEWAGIQRTKKYGDGQKLDKYIYIHIYKYKTIAISSEMGQSWAR